MKWLTSCGDSTQSDVPYHLKQEFALTPADDSELAPIRLPTPEGEYEAAHIHSSLHRNEIEASDLCGCFSCLETFAPSEIVEWTDERATALCPRCGIDAVLGSASGFPITADFLKGMHSYWFMDSKKGI